MNKRMIWLAAAVMAFLCVISLAAAQADTAGNVFISDSTPAQQTVQKDLYWAGGSRSFNGYQVGKSLIAAGRDITVSESEIGGSLRAAAYSLTLNGVDVTDNITAAGYELQLSGTTASGVYLVGRSLYFSGTADCISMAGETVTLEGEIHGNADISAAKIILGENLQVDGLLTVQSDSEPAIPSGAKIGEFLFKESKTNIDPEDAAEEVKAAKKSSGFGGFIRGLLGACLLAALICLLLGAEELGKPGEMLLSRTLPMLGTGFAGLFVIPGVCLILLFIRIGFPSAGLLGLLYTIACIFSLTYAGVTLAKTLIAKFTDHKVLNNVWVSSLIGAAVFHILRKIPVIGVILQAAAMIYTLGYFIQVVFLRLRNSDPDRVKGSLAAAPKEDVLEKVGGREGEDPTLSVNEENTAEAETEDILSGLPDYEAEIVKEEQEKSGSSIDITSGTD